ncbi:hypothetical protein HDU98_011644 [Podochytrium sp. JEL0797]|nr:hypothetical protein HDU98_011644 [Podochytrium sp. JEL0797]
MDKTAKRASFRAPQSPFRNALVKEAPRDAFVSLSVEALDAPQPMCVAFDGVVAVRSAASQITLLSDTTETRSLHAHVSDIASARDLCLASHGDGVVSVFTHAGPVSQVQVATTALASLALNPAALVAAVTHQDQLSLLDLPSAKPLASFSNTNSLCQSLAFSPCGSMLATTAKDNVVRLFDPRSSPQPVASSAPFHAGSKPSKVLWLGGGPASSALDYMLLTTGQSKTRDRECAIWDARVMRSPLFVHKVDSSTGSLIPLYDADSSLLFLTGKGDTTIRTFEVTPMTLNQTPTSFVASRAINNAVLLKKTNLDVMGCEVARIMALSTSLNGRDDAVLMPIHATVQRQHKSDFQSDLFPDTTNDSATLSGSEWFKGENAPILKISLDPTTPARISEQPINLVSFAVPIQDPSSVNERPSSPTPQRPSTPSTNAPNRVRSPSSLSMSFTVADESNIVKHPLVTNSPLLETIKRQSIPPPVSPKPDSLSSSSSSHRQSLPPPLASTRISTKPLSQDPLTSPIVETLKRQSIPPPLSPKPILSIAQVKRMSLPPPPISPKPLALQTGLLYLPPTSSSSTTPDTQVDAISHLFEEKFKTLLTRVSQLKQPAPPPPTPTTPTAPSDLDTKLDHLLTKLDSLTSRMDTFESNLPRNVSPIPPTNFPEDPEIRDALLVDLISRKIDTLRGRSESLESSLERLVLKVDVVNGRMEALEGQTQWIPTIVAGFGQLAQRQGELDVEIRALVNGKKGVEAGGGSEYEGVLEVALARQATRLVGMMEGMLKDQVEGVAAQGGIAAAGGKEVVGGGVKEVVVGGEKKESKRNSYRLPVVPNMGISTQLSKLKDVLSSSGAVTGGGRAGTPVSAGGEVEGEMKEGGGEETEEMDVVGHEA